MLGKWHVTHWADIQHYNKLLFYMFITCSTSIAKCPSLHARFFSVCLLRARVVHRHMHYRHRFSVRASIVIWRLLTLNDHCVKMRMKDVTLICCIICANTRTQRQYHDKYETSYSGYCNMRVYAVCVILTVHLVRA